MVLIGSFRRHMNEVGAAMRDFRFAGATILSPGDDQVVAEQQGFPYVSTDRARSPRLVEDRHLAALRTATLGWLVCPDGEIGTSSACEVGFAHGCGVPVFTKDSIKDLTIREYVTKTSSPRQALDLARQRPSFRPAPVDALMLDPDAFIADLERRVLELRSLLDLEPHRLQGSAARRFFELVAQFRQPPPP